MWLGEEAAGGFNCPHPLRLARRVGMCSQPARETAPAR